MRWPTPDEWDNIVGGVVVICSAIWLAVMLVPIGH